jgi:xylulokinase
MFAIGIDIGSSSIKAVLVESETNEVWAAVQAPATEMPIHVPQPGWAEQDPEQWWQYTCEALRRLLQQAQVSPRRVSAIGLAYQMHGLVAVDRDGRVVRPAIIWCDGRAVDIGRRACAALGEAYCLRHLLNSPGNFTAAKLRWLQENEPHHFERTHRALLPGDYIAYRLTGECSTTICGLSEAILWDFAAARPAYALLQHWGIDPDLLPALVPVFGYQGSLTAAAAAETGLREGTPLTYRAGDQPNNAFALQALAPGDAAATAGTSGVVYGVVAQNLADAQQRVNTFAHVNYRPAAPSLGILLCLNGCGSLYRWLRHLVGPRYTYRNMDEMAAAVAPGAEGLCILPFGNGAERLLSNQNPGAQICYLDFNRHTSAHLCRAALEGIACALTYGVGRLRELGLPLCVLRVGNDNLFRSEVFAQTLSNLTQVPVERFRASGAAGAARAALQGLGISPAASSSLKPERSFEPQKDGGIYSDIYERWYNALQQILT